MHNKKAAHTTTKSSLEECITDRNIMIKFIEFLGASYSLETFTFWLEARMVFGKNVISLH
jgi:hypothetical protein